MVRINWTNQAVSDLQNIYTFIASDSEYYAKREVTRLQLKTNFIKTHIRVGRVVPEFGKEEIRELIDGRYRIVYRLVSEIEVDILTVHHSAKEILRIQ